ncbi:putative zinc-type alcohol dehydrogenase-like protein [Backusella circina FSU 941]|nr:putative zinc-type alcohol dehydrogenase-like protein [Backusella circina FSU 941]
MSLPTEHSVYHITERTGYSAIKQFQEPVPTELGNQEVLIKVKAVSLNYRDLIIADGSYPQFTKPNVIPTSDASCEVVQVGSSVTDLQVGDRAITSFYPEILFGPMKDHNSAFGAGRDGLLSEYKVLPRYALNKIPKDTHLTHEEASVLVCTGVTAWNALYGSGRPLIAGQTVLILGTGGVSITALILAKAAGAVTIITSSSDEKLEHTKERYDPDYIINYKTYPDWEKKVLEITHGEGVDFVIENGGSGTIAKSIASTKYGGQISLVGFLSQPKSMPDVVLDLLMRGVTARGINVGSKQLTEDLINMVHARKLKMPVEKVFGFSQDQVHAAYAHLKSQTHIGKTVIRLD